MYDNLRARMGTLNGEPYVSKRATSVELDPGSQMLCIYSTGYTGWPTTIFNNALRSAPFDRLLEQSPSMLSVHAGGRETFGNDTAIASVEAAVAAYEAIGYKPPYMLFGHSMGYADLMAWARTRPNDIAGAICVYGLVDLDWVYDNNVLLDGVGAQSLINTAYGGSYVTATHGPTHNPRTFLPDMPFPTQAFYAPDDALLPPTMFTEADAALTNFSAIDIGNLGHTDAATKAASDHPRYKEFIRECQARWKAANP